MPNKPATQKPIGWYLKEADQLITASFEEAFDTYCITRFHWMVLRTIDDNQYINVRTHFEQVKGFITLDRLKGIIDNLHTRHWILSNEKDSYIFTEEGRKQFNDISAAYQQKVDVMMRGITGEEYNLTVTTLERIVTNLRNK